MFMSTEEKKEFKTLDDGQIRITHGTVSLLKHGDIKKLDNTTYSGYKLMYEDSKYGDKIKPFADGFLDQAWNSEAKTGLVALKPDDKFTLTEEAKGGWYNLQKVEMGHIGKAGVAKTAGAEVGSGGGGGSFNSEGAHAGMLTNNAVALLVAEGAKDVTAEQIVEKAKIVEAAAKLIKSEVLGVSDAPAAGNASEGAEADKNDPSANAPADSAAGGGSPI